MKAFGVTIDHDSSGSPGRPCDRRRTLPTVRDPAGIGMAGARRVGQVLRSPECSVLIMVTGVLYVGMLAVWGTASPLEVVQNISRLFPFKALYALFLINLALCMASRLPVTLRRCQPLHPPADLGDLARYRAREAIQGSQGPPVVGNLARALKRRGYRVHLGPHGRSFAALRGRFAPLGDLASHFALILILVGVLVSSSTRFSGDVVITEGQTFWGERGEYLRFHPREDFSRRAPRFSVTVEKIGAAFYRNELFFTDLYASVQYAKDSQAGSATLRLSQPLWLDGARINLVGYGFAPVYVLRGPDGWEMDGATVNLNVFPPGTEDSFRLRGLPHQVHVTVFPDPVLTEGVVRSRSNNLRAPVLHVRVYRHKIRVYEGMVPVGSSASFDGLRLEFPALRLSGQLRVVRDPGASWVFAAFLLGIGGLAMRILWCRREVAGLLVSQGGATVLHVGAEAEFFRDLHPARLHGLLRRGGERWA